MGCGTSLLIIIMASTLPAIGLKGDVDVWLADWSTGRDHYDRKPHRFRSGQVGDALGGVQGMAGHEELRQN